MQCKTFLLLENFYTYFWQRIKGEWPSGLMRCNHNRKVPGSNITRHWVRVSAPTLLRGSRRPSDRKCTINAVINIG